MLSRSASGARFPAREPDSPALSRLGHPGRYSSTAIPSSCRLPQTVWIVCLLPHALEFASNPHQILREVQRVLVPEGHLIVAGFNPWSLWGVRRALKSGREAHYPWCGRFINLPRLKDWLALLGFEVAGGRMSCYAPPFSREQWLGRFRFMEAAGDRWWPIGGGVYFVDAVKRVPGDARHYTEVERPRDGERAARGGVAAGCTRAAAHRRERTRVTAGGYRRHLYRWRVQGQPGPRGLGRAVAVRSQ